MSATDTVIIVLGHPADEEGNPAPILKSRLDKAIDLYREGKAEKIIVTGAAVYNRFVEAEVMAVYCINNGIPASDIFMEPRARNTYENAGMVKEIMIEKGYTKAIVVTSIFHVKRAKLFFKKQLRDVQVVGCPYPEGFSQFRHLFNTFKEFAILTLYHLRLLNRRYEIKD